MPVEVVQSVMKRERERTAMPVRRDVREVDEFVRREMVRARYWR